MEFASASPGRLDGGNVDLLHRHHRLEGTLGFTAPSRKRIGERARGDLPGEAPAVLTPTALAFGTAITDDRVPVSVRLFLILRRDLEGKGLAMPERRAAAETETGNAHDGELHRQHIALLAARIVSGGLVNSGYFTVRKSGGVEARRFMRVFVEPETNRVFRLHVRVCNWVTGNPPAITEKYRLPSASHGEPMEEAAIAEQAIPSARQAGPHRAWADHP